MKKLPEGITKNEKLPYSVALETRGPRIDFSGVLPELVDGPDGKKKPKSQSLEEQTREVLLKMKKMLNDCGLTFNHIVDVLIYVDGEPTIEKYEIVNRIYVEFLRADKAKDLPVRGFFGGFLLFGSKVEIKFSAVRQVPEFLSTRKSATDGE